MGEDVVYIGSRLYTAAVPTVDAGIEAQIASEELR